MPNHLNNIFDEISQYGLVDNPTHNKCKENRPKLSIHMDNKHTIRFMSFNFNFNFTPHIHYSYDIVSSKYYEIESSIDFTTVFNMCCNYCKNVIGDINILIIFNKTNNSISIVEYINTDITPYIYDGNDDYLQNYLKWTESRIKYILLNSSLLNK